MELLVTIVLVFMVTFSIFGFVNMIKQINNLSDEQEIDKRIPPCVGHEIESQKENDKSESNFMYNWIREKSGKK
jgi:Na+/H+ antiporter NhaC